jgi:ankyrin repeat protein
MDVTINTMSGEAFAIPVQVDSHVREIRKLAALQLDAIPECLQLIYGEDVLADEDSAASLCGEDVLALIVKTLEELMKILHNSGLRYKTLNSKAWTGQNALHAASEMGKLFIVKLLLKDQRFTGVNEVLFRPFPQRWTALHLAAHKGHAPVCAALLDAENFTVANGNDSDGHTALHLAAQIGHIEVVHMLLASDRFSQVNSVCNRGRTALHHAAANGRLEVVEAILEHPQFIALSVKDNKKKNAAELAASCSHMHIEEVICKHPKARSLKAKWAISPRSVIGHYH